MVLYISILGSVVLGQLDLEILQAMDIQFLVLERQVVLQQLVLDLGFPVLRPVVLGRLV